MATMMGMTGGFLTNPVLSALQATMGIGAPAAGAPPGAVGTPSEEEEEEVLQPPHLEHAFFCGKGAACCGGGSSFTTGAAKPSPRASEGSAVRPRSRQLMPRLTLRMRDAVVTAIAVAELSANAAAIPAGIAAG